MAAPRSGSAFRPDQLWHQVCEPLFWLDSTCRLIWANRAWEELTGQSAGAVAGLSCSPCGPTGSEAESELAASLAPPPEAVRGEPSGSLALIPRNDGELVRRRVEFWPFRDPDGKLVGLLGQIREPAVASVPDSRACQLQVQLQELREQLRRHVGLDSLIGTGPAHDRLLQQIRLAASSSLPVLIVGEPGTGKRLVGQLIHDSGALRQGPILPLDCEALPAEMIEQELLKLDRSAGDGQPPAVAADSASPSPAIRQPGGRTLLIGDVLTLPRDLQLRLAEILIPERRIRLIAMTSGDPDGALHEERLRPELYHAMTILVLRIPSLRNRRRDIPLLAQHLLERINRRKGLRCSGFDADTISILEGYDWPGNVRELDRVVAAAHERVTSESAETNPTYTISVKDLPASIRGNLGAAYLPPVLDRPVQPLDELLADIERRLIETALSRARQNKSRRAELLGISRPRLYRRIKELNLPYDNEADSEPLPAPATTAP